VEYLSKPPNDLLFRAPAPGLYGYFGLMKSIFVIDGEVYPGFYTGRCDNLTYNSTFVTHQTPYSSEAMYEGKGTPITNWSAWSRVLDAIPDFNIMFMSCKEVTLDGSTYPADYVFQGYASTLWFGKTIIELLKNIREWSFMVDEPFNSDHPMALYSKMALETLNPPQAILDEIDELPDMHLARYLKGDPNHRDLVEGFPQMSDDMRLWFTEKLEEFAPKSTNQRLLELNID
jgi:hypothetical protein